MGELRHRERDIERRYGEVGRDREGEIEWERESSRVACESR